MTEQLKGLFHLSASTRNLAQTTFVPPERLKAMSASMQAIRELVDALGTAYKLARTNTPGSILCTCSPERADHASHARTCMVAVHAAASFEAGRESGRIQLDRRFNHREQQGARTTASRIAGYRQTIRNLQRALLIRDRLIAKLRKESDAWERRAESVREDTLDIIHRYEKNAQEQTAECERHRAESDSGKLRIGLLGFLLGTIAAGWMLWLAVAAGHI